MDIFLIHSHKYAAFPSFYTWSYGFYGVYDVFGVYGVYDSDSPESALFIWPWNLMVVSW